VAEEDLGRTGSDGRASVGPGAPGTPDDPAGQTRTGQRRLARVRQRRRWAAGGLTVACLLALVSYLGSRQPEPPDGNGGVPAGAPTGSDRPTGRVPGVRMPDADIGAASPGLRPRQRPPATPTAPPTPTVQPPAQPYLAVTRNDVPAVVDLTAVGTRDWVHWGLRGGNSVVRKRTGTGQILDEGGRDGRDSYDTNPESYRWRGGTPVTSVDATPSGAYACGVGNGFALAVAGDGELRTVHLYAGLWMARGRLDVRLSTGGPTTTLRLEDPHTTHTADFTIRFRAPKGGKLLMSWITEVSFNRSGNVALQAVALR
jgi:hypothetical protein